MIVRLLVGAAGVWILTWLSRRSFFYCTVQSAGSAKSIIVSFRQVVFPQNFSEAGNAEAEEGERERPNAGNSEAGCCFPEERDAAME